MSKQIALDFVDAINSHDVDRIIALMANDHTFIDAWGGTESKDAMRKGWPGYFAWFPDYWIEVSELLVSGDTVAIFGFAGGTYQGKTTPSGENSWRLPAAWRVVVENEKVKVWQVYADSKVPFDIMNGADNRAINQKEDHS